jgi:hypothetical protein
MPQHMTREDTLHGMRFVTALIFASSMTLAACGGSSSSEGAATTPAIAPVAAPDEEAGGGSASVGDNCDFGGAERSTCTGGLVCCYPEEGEVEYGTCAQDCPGYD